MKRIVWILLAGSLIGSLAQALTVSEASIAGKTDLVAIAQVSVNGTVQSILTDNKGFSLYTFALDSNGVSKCTAGCIAAWAPQHVPAGSLVSAPFAVIQGNDGQAQLTLSGLPLYHYHADTKPGEAFGQYPQWSTISVVN